MPNLNGLLMIIAFLIPIVFSVQSENTKHHLAERHLKRARQYEAVYDPRAEEEYKRAVKYNNGNYPEALLELAFYLTRHLRFGEAIEPLELYIKQTPGEDHTDDYVKLRDTKRAENLKVRLAGNDHPELSDLLEYANLVSQYAKNHQRDALRYAETAVKLYPTSSDAHLLLGRMLIGSRQQERRYAALMRAVELDPNSSKAHHYLGWYYIESFRGREAAENFQKSLELSGSSLTDSWQGLGHALALQGRNKEAIEAFKSYLLYGNVTSQYEKVIRGKIKDLEGK